MHYHPPKAEVGSLVIANTGEIGIYLGESKSIYGWTQSQIFLTFTQKVHNFSFGQFHVFDMEKRREFLVSPGKKSFLPIGRLIFQPGYYTNIICMIGGKQAASFQDPDLGYIIVRNAGSDLDKQKRAEKLGIAVLTHDDFVSRFLGLDVRK